MHARAPGCAAALSTACLYPCARHHVVVLTPIFRNPAPYVALSAQFIGFAPPPSPLPLCLHALYHCRRPAVVVAGTAPTLCCVSCYRISVVAPHVTRQRRLTLLCTLLWSAELRQVGEWQR